MKRKANLMTTPGEPKIVEKASFQIVGLRYEGLNQHGEVPALWDIFIPRAGELVADPSRWVAYGVARSIPGVDASERWEYLAGVEVTPGKNAPPDMVVWEIPALPYAVLPANDVPGIGPASQYFYQDWLPNSKEWEGGAPLMLEVYPETFGQDMILY
jgi:predicted transcriptional regulator YdeE